MKRAFTPIDEEAREQIRTRLDDNLCVEAGAGTGKTTVLVDRIVRILRTTDTRADELAVITFTEKAAAELSSRVRRGIEDELVSEPLQPDEQSRLEAALRDLNRAHIETIHAFASSLLRERPIEAHLDPGFQVLDEMPAQLAFDAAYRDWIDIQMSADPPPRALVDALNLDLGFQKVREAADRLHRYRDVLPLPPYRLEPVDAAAFFDRITAARNVLRDLNPIMIDDTDKTFVAIPDYVRLCDDFLSLRDNPDLLPRALVNANLVGYNGNMNNWRTKSECGVAKTAMTAISLAVKEHRAALRQNAMAALLTLLQEFVAFYDARRKTDGVADFDDLLIWARDLVRNSDEVRRYFAAKYRRIFVDEFQDTDSLQAEIVVRLCGEGPPAEDWRNTRLRPGSLFVVGDPKQSIYRFRRADIGMYDDVKSRVFGGKPLEIVQNFRSVRPIIDWVNGRFEHLIERIEGVQPAYIELAEDPSQEGDESSIIVLESPEPPSRATAVREAESAAIASLIAREIPARAWLVRDMASGDLRPACWRDIVIIVPNRTQIEIYEAALMQADIPFRHEGGRTFYVRQEVRELVAILRAIDDPEDGIAAIAALRSSAFGCSDEDLFLHREHGRFSHAVVRADAEGRVPDALRVLHAFSLDRHVMPLPDLVRSVLDKTRLVEFAMLQPHGDQVAANLLKVIDQARAFVEADGGGLRAFVRWLSDSIDRAGDPRTAAVPESEAPISEETDDVVRIITIHASKGLEFPIVIFANLETERPDMTNVIVDTSHGLPTLRMRIGKKDDGFQTPGYDDADIIEQQHKMAEEKRLLYVAATRARDRLIVPFFGKSPTRKPVRPALNEWLRDAGAATTGLRIDASTLPVLAGDLPIWRRPIDAVPETAIRATIDDREAWKAAHDVAIGEASLGLLVRTASSLKHDAEPPSSPDIDVRRGSAADFGTAVHALLERIDLDRPQDVAGMAPAIAAEFSLPGREPEIARVAARALASEAIGRARRSRRLLREVPFAAPLFDADDERGGIAKGRIDLLFQEDGPDGPTLVVVDFKTDNVSAAEADVRANTLYRTQAMVYAWAAYRATNLAVSEIIFIFARPGVGSAITVNADFMREADALMTGSPAPA